MYRTITFAFFLLIIGSCYSQELKKKYREIDYPLSESYHVLKSDKKIKHGEYVLKLNDLEIQKGNFTNNQKTGDWYYFIGNNSAEFIYNFDLQKIVSDTLGKARPAVYSQGSMYFSYLVSKDLDASIMDPLLGSTHVLKTSFVVHTDGTLSDFEILLGCGQPAANNELLRAVRKAAEEHPWFPAINEKGERVKATFIWSMRYTVEKL